MIFPQCLHETQSSWPGQQSVIPGIGTTMATAGSHKHEFSQLGRLGRRRRIPAGRGFMLQEEEASFVAVIISGAVKLTRMLSDGREQILSLGFATDLVGPLLNRTNAYSVTSLMETEINFYPVAAFRNALLQHPELLQVVFHQTLCDLDAARELQVLLGRRSAKERVASFLVTIAVRTGKVERNGSGTPVSASLLLPMSRQDIADFLGLTLETVSRQFSTLEGEGNIHIAQCRRRVLVPDLGRLIQGSGGSV